MSSEGEILVNKGVIIIFLFFSIYFKNWIIETVYTIYFFSCRCQCSVLQLEFDCRDYVTKKTSLYIHNKIVGKFHNELICCWDVALHCQLVGKIWRTRESREATEPNTEYIFLRINIFGMVSLLHWLSFLNLF